MADIYGPAKMAIRCGGQSIIRAYLLPMDQAHPGPDDVPIATLNREVAEMDPQAFEEFTRFVDAILERANTAMLKAAGIKAVASHTEHRTTPPRTSETN